MNNVSARTFTDCKVFLSLTTLLFCLLAARQLPAQTNYTATDVGPLNDLNEVFSAGGGAVNNQGVVSGQAALPAGTDRAFRWMRGSALDLGTLGGGQMASGRSINQRGQIAGWSETSPGGPVHAFFWGQGAMLDLDSWGGDFSQANHVNDRGQAVGFACTTVPDPEPNPAVGSTECHAFLWTAGVLTDLKTLGGPNSIAIGNNSSGQVVGWSQTDYNIDPNFGFADFHAAVWVNGTITLLPGLGGGIDLATAINEQGVSVGVALLPDDSATHAVLWQSGQLSDLDPGPAVDLGSQANAINNSGEVVGMTISNNFVPFAAIWQNGVMSDLNTLIDSSSGWYLFSATGINDMGQIAGVGFFNGSVHLFLLTPSAGGGKTGSVGTPPPVSYQLVQSLIWGRTGLLKQVRMGKR